VIWPRRMRAGGWGSLVSWPHLLVRELEGGLGVGGVRVVGRVVVAWLAVAELGEVAGEVGGGASSECYSHRDRQQALTYVGGDLAHRQAHHLRNRQLHHRSSGRPASGSRVQLVTVISASPAT
jgi:hypothetical protein